MTMPTPTTRVLEDTGSQVEPPYHLILLDDDEHTYHYVVAMLGSIFGYAPEKGFAIACVVDKDGQAILMTGGLEEVRLKQDAVHAFGADPAMPQSKGSMSAVIEPAHSPA
ncbi:MAG TPA: ATP-dependent Clp protease adaptor ClpS [Tepidiformaceae bacterium]|nr:ATP-dependent Clp protease adaptor ClpS [Tepidiformaceae bacterium]